MTLEQTRQLGIEFERRVQTMIPEKEFADKLDTDTIYSFLNQYQDKFIHEIYSSLDQLKSDSKISIRIERILQSLLQSCETSDPLIFEWRFGEKFPITFKDYIKQHDRGGQSILDTVRSITYSLPKDFAMYIKSVSTVSSSYTYKNRKSTGAINILSNELVSQSNIKDIIESPNNSLRILRHPFVVLDTEYELNPTITIVHDMYTTITGLRLLYYRQPKHFDIMTATPCELPMDAFDDIVSGAVDLYVQYVAGAEARKRMINERQANQKENKNTNEQ